MCTKTEQGCLLDTLPVTSEILSSGSAEKLRKRAKRKALAHAQALKMLELDTPLARGYERTLSCGAHLQLMKDGTLKSWFCGHRWCPVCSANRQGNIINGYQHAVDKMKEPFMVTLTIPSVKQPELEPAIKYLPYCFALVKDNLRKNGIKLNGIRALECNYNPAKETYNPHFHMLIEGEIEAQALVCYWLRANKDATEYAQDIQPAQEGTLKEIVKYTTKTLIGKKFYPHAMDNINKALRGVRVFQAYGNIRKAKNIPVEAPESTCTAVEAPKTNQPDIYLTPEKISPSEAKNEVIAHYWWWGDGWYNSERVPLVYINHSASMKRLLCNIRGAPLYRHSLNN